MAKQSNCGGHFREDERAEKKKNSETDESSLGWNQNLKVACIGDNMREVAVTEGDKVEAQIRFGVSVKWLRSHQM
jgi:L-arabinose isomerase